MMHSASDCSSLLILFLFIGTGDSCKGGGTVNSTEPVNSTVVMDADDYALFHAYSDWYYDQLTPQNTSVSIMEVGEGTIENSTETGNSTNNTTVETNNLNNTTANDDKESSRKNRSTSLEVNLEKLTPNREAKLDDKNYVVGTMYEVYDQADESSTLDDSTSTKFVDSTTENTEETTDAGTTKSQNKKNLNNEDENPTENDDDVTTTEHSVKNQIRQFFGLEPTKENRTDEIKDQGEKNSTKNKNIKENLNSDNKTNKNMSNQRKEVDNSESITEKSVQNKIRQFFGMDDEPGNETKSELHSESSNSNTKNTKESRSDLKSNNKEAASTSKTIQQETSESTSMVEPENTDNWNNSETTTEISVQNKIRDFFGMDSDSENSTEGSTEMPRKSNFTSRTYSRDTKKTIMSRNITKNKNGSKPDEYDEESESVDYNIETTTEKGLNNKIKNFFGLNYGGENNKSTGTNREKSTLSTVNKKMGNAGIISEEKTMDSTGETNVASTKPTVHKGNENNDGMHNKSETTVTNNEATTELTVNKKIRNFFGIENDNDTTETADMNNETTTELTVNKKIRNIFGMANEEETTESTDINNETTTELTVNKKIKNFFGIDNTEKTTGSPDRDAETTSELSINNKIRKFFGMGIEGANSTGNTTKSLDQNNNKTADKNDPKKELVDETIAKTSKPQETNGIPKAGRIEVTNETDTTNLTSTSDKSNNATKLEKTTDDSNASNLNDTNIDTEQTENRIENSRRNFGIEPNLEDLEEATDDTTDYEELTEENLETTTTLGVWEILNKNARSAFGMEQEETTKTATVSDEDTIETTPEANDGPGRQKTPVKNINSVDSETGFVARQIGDGPEVGNPYDSYDDNEVDQNRNRNQQYGDGEYFSRQSTSVNEVDRGRDDEEDNTNLKELEKLKIEQLDDSDNANKGNNVMDKMGSSMNPVTFLKNDTSANATDDKDKADKDKNLKGIKKLEAEMKKFFRLARVPEPGYTPRPKPPKTKRSGAEIQEFSKVDTQLKEKLRTEEEEEAAAEDDRIF